MVQAKTFINLLRRSTKSKYQTLIMHNRMLMQCYNIDEDSDVGLHYILFFPDTVEYQHSLFDATIILSPSEILKQYTAAHKVAEEERKARQLKPKDLVEEVCLQRNHLKFIFYLQDDLFNAIECEVEYPVDPNSGQLSNIQKQFLNLISRIKPGGICLEFNGLKLGLQDKVTSYPDIFVYNVKCGKKRIRIPLYKTMFLGIKEVDMFRFNIQETFMDEVYIYTIQIGKNKIEEAFWGYLINY